MPWGDYRCACVDCGSTGIGCEQRGWSSACDGDAPCRVPATGAIGTVQDGSVCVTRQGAASGFEQLCALQGAAAPHPALFNVRSS